MCNYSDPFGLCPRGSVEVLNDCMNPGAALGMAIGALFNTAEMGFKALAGAARASRTAAVSEEGIYEFVSASGKTYVGQSGQISTRIGQHLRSGKFAGSDATQVARTRVLGGKTVREIAEQTRINELGGIENLENKVNPIGAMRQHLLSKPPEY